MPNIYLVPTYMYNEIQIEFEKKRLRHIKISFGIETKIIYEVLLKSSLKPLYLFH